LILKITHQISINNLFIKNYNPMWTKQKIKQTFFDYFSQNNHTIVKESRLIPPNNDQSILFTNSGMNQFKNIFLGTETAPTYNACNVQKCIRAGGKHNDFDDVGKDTYHHSLFNMLGNWSFNFDSNSKDKSHTYYKEDAIKYAWDLLTRVYGIDKTRLYVTYFGGNDKIKPDYEAKEYWLKYVDSARILPYDRENFWEMGAYGPCGPCSEIHYDLVGNRDASTLVNKDDPTVVELWNLVFMQYNKLETGELIELKKKSFDGGAGFERICMVLQDKTSNYDTDVFQPIFQKIYELTKVECTEKTIVSYRIIADHIRSLIYCLNDDIVPSPYSRGFIVGKLFKRALHHACQNLNAKTSFMSDLAELVIPILAEDDPNADLLLKQNLIVYIIQAEESKYAKLIWKSVTSFQKLLEKKDKFITKDEMGILIRTRGIPVDVIDAFIKDNGFDFESF